MRIQIYHLILFILFALYRLPVLAQEEGPSTDFLDSEIEKAFDWGAMDQWTKCFDVANEVQTSCEARSYAKGKGRCLALKGRASFALGNMQTGLKNYLYAEMVFLPLNEASELSAVYAELGKYYLDQGLFGHAIINYQKSEALVSNVSKQKALAKAFLGAEKYDEAIKYYLMVLDSRNAIPANERYLIQLELLRVYLLDENLKQALELGLEMDRKLANDASKLSQRFSLYNELGCIYKGLKQNSNANLYFGKALDLAANGASAAITEEQKASLYINLGVINSAANEFSKAKEYFQKAILIYSRLNNKQEIATTNNFIAANYYLSGSNPQALKHATQAEAIGLQLNDNIVLATSYQILSKIHQTERYNEKAERYAALAKKAKNILADENKAKLLKRVTLEKAAVIREKELRNMNLTTEDEKRRMKDYRIESEKRAKALELQAKELELNKSELENQRLEKERISQLLALANQRQRMDELQKEKEIQQLLIRQKEGNEKQRLQEISLLEKEKRIQQQKLQEAKRFRQLGVLIFVLVGAILIIAVFTLIFMSRAKNKTQKQHLKIVEQAAELQATNDELHQRQEEVQLQNSLLEESNKKLNIQNNVITSSMNAASIIQGAVLPTMEKLLQFFRDYFILFRPRDIVSGDFYWIEEVKGQLFIIEADCTGHGVPGAFMSMIGKTLLDKIILVKQVYEPANILNALHKEVVIALHQETTGNDNGMDVAVIRLCKNEEDGVLDLSYCGAKSPVCIKDLKTGEFVCLKESRKSIGGKASNHLEFEECKMQLKNDTMIYLYSDGFIDQNDQERRRLGSDAFKKILNNISSLSCAEQEKFLVDCLDKQLVGTTQRDDILVLGLKVRPSDLNERDF